MKKEGKEGKKDGKEDRRKNLGEPVCEKELQHILDASKESFGPQRVEICVEKVSNIWGEMTT